MYVDDQPKSARNRWPGLNFQEIASRGRRTRSPYVLDAPGSHFQYDQFLRNTWLECYGQLSVFEIEGVRYAIDAGMDDDWDLGEKSMRVRLYKVFNPGQICSYEYDYGTTTDLKLKVISERQVAAKVNAIQVLARNVPPVILCEECGKPATEFCSQYIFDDRGWLCGDCALEHDCGEEMSG